ncbi:hypothetical protein MP228_010768 [Amoeboaphelidium protococcarum]|nr:hypothetical protein MP228_010768 [Amoeboaphelidium protococcarum]
MHLINTILAGVVAVMTVSAQLPLYCPNLSHYNAGRVTLQQKGASGTVCTYANGASCNLSPAASVCYIGNKPYPAKNNPDGTVTLL